MDGKTNLHLVTKSTILLHWSDCKFVSFNCTNVKDLLTLILLIFLHEYRTICLVLFIES